MTRCDMYDPESDMVTDPESLRKSYSKNHCGRRCTFFLFSFCWAQWSFCYDCGHMYYSYTLKKQLNFIVQFVPSM